MKALKKIPNILTLLRMVLTLIYLLLLHDLYLYSNDRLYFILAAIVFILICATDFIDGKIARRLKVSSSLGAALDVTADFIFIISSNIMLIIQNILPLWFMMIVFAKFIEFIITSYIIKKYNNFSRSLFIFDYFGRIAAANFFLIPGITLFVYIGLNIMYINIIIYITLILTFTSSLARCMNCHKALIIKESLDNYDNAS